MAIFQFHGASFSWNRGLIHMHISSLITGITLLCHCQGTSHKRAGSNSSKNEMSDVMLEFSEPNKLQHEKLLMYSKIFTFGPCCCCPWNAMLKHFFPLKLCLSLRSKYIQCFVFIWSLFQLHFKVTAKASTLWNKYGYNFICRNKSLIKVYIFKFAIKFSLRFIYVT